MGTINKRKQKKKDAHLNFMGGPSYFLKNPVAQLQMAAASCFFGEPQYYHDGTDGKKPSRKNPRYHTGSRLTDAQLRYLRKTLDAIDPQEWRGQDSQTRMETAIDKALEHDPEATLQLAADLRNKWFIRTTPQVILVRAAHNKQVKGTSLVRQYARHIIKRADEPAVGLAYQIAAYGRKKIPNALKKAWKDYLENANEYSLGKYRMENRTVKTVDVVNLVHPASEVVNKLVRGDLKTTGKTWESIRSAGGSWEEALGVMGHMALLRNLRNLLQKGVDTDLFVEKLKGGAATGKQLPFRYYSAYNAVRSIADGQVLDAIEECLEQSLGNLPQFKGKVMSLADNSGSATGTTTSSLGTMRMSTIANLQSVITGKVAEKGYVGVFGDGLKTMAIRKGSSVFDQLDKMEKMGAGIGGGTEHGIWLFWDKAIKNKEHWDHVFVYSDMQAGHGGLYGTGGYNDYIWDDGSRYGRSTYIDVPKLINTYRAKVNPNVNVYLVQVAGYQDTIVPEYYNRTYILGGWSDQLLKFAAEMSGLMDGQQ
jgi:hypothetical protein